MDIFDASISRDILILIYRWYFHLSRASVIYLFTYLNIKYIYLIETFFIISIIFDFHYNIYTKIMIKKEWFFSINFASTTFIFFLSINLSWKLHHKQSDATNLLV